MKSLAEPFKTADAVSTAANFTTAPYDTAAFFGISWQIIATGTPTGNLTLQMSNDKLNWTTQPTDAVNAVNPTVYSAASKNDFLVYHTMRPMKWYRFAWAGSGDGTITIWGCGIRLG